MISAGLVKPSTARSCDGSGGSEVLMTRKPSTSDRYTESARRIGGASLLGESLTIKGLSAGRVAAAAARPVVAGCAMAHTGQMLTAASNAIRRTLIMFAITP